ncbi:MAG TPA: tRNA (adenosine(37)-N6)-dimethylallyltransferase MiaA [Bacteroidia bacterium]|nr:tRNA (adenosine(37)-N6)-dimethylallyltransferase MiaA [Bacteroidia bacterium]
MKVPLLVVVIGPTGVGKTPVAIQIATHFKTEIISADSRQMFRELPVGTAAPTLEEMKGVSHHFTGNLSVSEPMDAGQWAQQARVKIEELFQKHDLVVCAGGSGLYVNALLNGMDELPGKDENLREELGLEMEAQGIGSLQEKLKKLDPEFYAEIDVNNPKRLIRAIEVCILSGQKYSELRSGKNKELPFRVIKIGLDLPREELYERINARVDEMMKNGLEEEARSVLSHRNQNALATVGYREMFAYFDGETTLSEAVELIKQHSRNYAKRQMTWWRKDGEIRWFHPGKMDEIISTIESEKTSG